MPTSLIIPLETLTGYVTIRSFFYLFGGITLIKVLERAYPPIRKLFSPLRHLAGPPNESLIFGNLKHLFAVLNSGIHEEWIGEYGPTFAYRGFLSSYRLYTVDTLALTYIMTQPSSFPKPENVRRSMADGLGEGLFFAEADAHKRQRRIMNSSFGPPQIRELMPVFWQKSNKLRDAWVNNIKNNPEGTAVIEVLSWLTRATLDVIGVAGFDYHFNSLDGNDDDELAMSFNRALESGHSVGAFAILRTFIPILKLIPDKQSRTAAANKETMRRIGMKLISDKKAALDYDYKTGSASQSRDLLTLLIKANMAHENESQRMNDEEVLAQIPTFLIAAHDTTTASIAWALYELTQHSEVQRKLRKELLESGLGDEPSMANLDKLPYLDNFVRECLRVYPPGPLTIREAAHDVHIPVSKSYKDRYGVERTHISLLKGDVVFIPILAMNRLKEIWGDDAMQFRPERWDSLPKGVKDMPGVWGHLMTFIHGSRSCIGYRFALIEIKAILYSLVRAIEFEIDPRIQIEGISALVTRPRVVSQPEKGYQLPLLCRPVVAI